MYEKEVRLKDDSCILLRPVKLGDFELLWSMLSTLSNNSLQFLPHQIKKNEVKSLLEHLDFDMFLPIVAEVNDVLEKSKIVAFASLQFETSVSRKHRAEFDIVVHDDFQNKGLGTLLTKHLIDIAKKKGIKKVKLKTSTKNERAIHLYKKLGFKIEGKLEKEHFHNLKQEYGDDYLMALFI